MTKQSPVPRDATLAPDFSDIRNDAERYRAERDHWRHLFDQLAAEFPEPVIVVDDDGRLTHWNEEQASFVGLPAEQAVGKHAHEVIGTEEVTETLAEEVARTGKTIRETDVRTITNTEGQKGHGRAMGVPLTAPDGSVVGSFEVLYQVTDLVEQRQSMEHVQTQVREELEQTVGSLEAASTQVTENVDVIIPHVSAFTLNPMGSSAEGVYGGEPWNPGADNEASEIFIEAFEEEYDETPNQSHLHTYESVLVYAMAVEQAGTFHPPTVIREMETFEWSQAWGDSVFRECDHQVERPYYFVRGVSDERAEEMGIRTEVVRTTDPLVYGCDEPPATNCELGPYGDE